MPKAKLAVVITPIAASAPMMRRRVTRLTREAGRQAPDAGADEEVEADGGADRRPAEDGVATARGRCSSCRGA